MYIHTCTFSILSAKYTQGALEWSMCNVYYMYMNTCARNDKMQYSGSTCR